MCKAAYRLASLSATVALIAAVAGANAQTTDFMLNGHNPGQDWRASLVAGQCQFGAPNRAPSAGAAQLECLGQAAGSTPAEAPLSDAGAGGFLAEPTVSAAMQCNGPLCSPPASDLLPPTPVTMVQSVSRGQDLLSPANRPLSVLPGDPNLVIHAFGSAVSSFSVSRGLQVNRDTSVSGASLVLSANQFVPFRAVPEPVSAGVLATGLAGLVLARRRRG